MSDNGFSITSINPWRMLLFGSLGVLIPITLYMVSLLFINIEVRREYDTLIAILMIVVLILGVLGGYIGFKYSSSKIELKMDEYGLTEIICPNLFFLPNRTILIPWNEISNHSLTEDSKGKILELNLQNNKKITIGIAYVLSDSHNFDNFYAVFLKHINNYNIQHTTSQSPEGPIHRSPSFYQSRWGQLLAYFLIFLMVGSILLFFISAKGFNIWECLRLLFFDSLAAYYVWRSLFGKE